MATPHDSARRRAGIRIGVAAQVAMAFVLLLAVNYAGFHYYVRGDWSAAQKYRLGPQSEAALKQLPGAATVYVYFSPTGASPGHEVYGDVVNLLKEYQVAAGDKLTVEHVDPTRNPARARELQAKHGFGAQENLLVVELGGRSKQIVAVDMADYDPIAQLSGEAPRVRAFKGEQAITGALIELSEPKPRAVYFLEGQGEAPVGSGSDLSALAGYIAKQGVRVAPLNLGLAGGVPEDAGALVLAGARYDLDEDAMAILRAYWAKEGRIMVLLDPNAKTPMLREFLSGAGVTPRDDRVLRTVKLGVATGILREVRGQFSPDNRVTRRMNGAEMMMPGGTCSLALSGSAPGGAPEAAITAEAPYWGETEYITDANKGVAFDEGRDAAPPLVLAATVERGGVSDQKVDVGAARMVVVGNCGFIQDNALTGPGLDFFLSSLNWMLDRGHLAGVAPKATRAFSLNLTDIETGRIALYTLVVIPSLALVAGIAVWWRRRR